MLLRLLALLWLLLSSFLLDYDTSLMVPSEKSWQAIGVALSGLIPGPSAA
jgi:hypothetical protein